MTVQSGTAPAADDYVLSGRETPDWMACSVLQQMPRLARPSLPLLPQGQLKMQSLQKRKRHAVIQTETAVMNEAWGLGPQ